MDVWNTSEINNQTLGICSTHLENEQNHIRIGPKTYLRDINILC